MLSCFSMCLTLYDPMDCSPPRSSVHVILQARILEWVAISFSRGSSPPRDRTWVSCIAGRFFTIWASKEFTEMVYSIEKRVSVTPSCPTLYDPRDCSPGGSSVHGILQARILESVAIPFSRGSSWSRDWTWVSHIAGRFFTIWASKEAHKSESESRSFLSDSLRLHGLFSG